MTLKFGIHDNIENEDYHAVKEVQGLPAFSSSFAKTFVKQSPYHAANMSAPKDSDAMRNGSALHAWALEGIPPHCGPESRVKRKEWKEALEAAETLGTIALTQRNYELVESMNHALFNNPHIANLLTDKGGWAERSVFVEFEVICMKARPDFYIPERNMIIDVKTAVSAKPADFERQAQQLGYILQAGWYVIAMREAGVFIDRFMFAVVQNSAPFATSLVEVGQEDLSYAVTFVQGLIPRIKACHDAGEYPTGWPPIHTTNLEYI